LAGKVDNTGLGGCGHKQRRGVIGVESDCQFSIRKLWLLLIYTQNIIISTNNNGLAFGNISFTSVFEDKAFVCRAIFIAAMKSLVAGLLEANSLCFVSSALLD
jgi:hypothetical protein